MATNIRLRSPYYLYETEVGSSSATLTLQINGVDEYNVTKLCDSGGNALFEISELSRDFIDVEFYGTYASDVLPIVWTIEFYDSVGTLLNTFTDTIFGFDSYGEFTDGYNPSITTGGLLQSNQTIYLPEGQTGTIPTELNNTILYTEISSIEEGNKTIGSNVVNIKRICEPKYQPIKIVFVNKFGAFQDLWFFKKRVERLQVSKDTFKRNILSSSGSYSIYKHSETVLNTIARELFVANTGFVDESLNDTFKELMLSEKVWAVINTQVTPILINSRELQYKTSLNDKLINYTLEFEYAYDTINSIR